MTSVSDQLRTAAKVLRAHADAAEADVDTNPYWRSALTERPDWYANGVRNGLGGPSGELAALMGPDTGRALADWLDHHASILTAATQYDPDSNLARYALAVARALNGDR
ncbi:hypothetical protein ABGT92_23665 [Streptomyces cinereoruber]|uniref:hypothetical protein n=1 Tax=Streptomyces cinereoruber TaxID=67260 RepID=UPI00345DC5AA